MAKIVTEPILLSKLQYNMLKYISEHPLIQGHVIKKHFHEQEYRIKANMEFFIENNLIYFTPETKFPDFSEKDRIQEIMNNVSWLDMNYHIFLSEYGHAVMDSHHEKAEEIIKARKDATFAKVVSVVSIIVSITISFLPYIF